MKDVNVYTTSLFSLGLYSFIGLLLYFKMDHFKELLLITTFIVLLDLFPLKLPSGIIYSAGSIGLLFVLLKYGLVESVLSLLVSTLVIFIKLSGDIRKINWFRFFVTVGMLFFCTIIVYAITNILAIKGVLIISFLAVLLFELVNLLLHVGIHFSISGNNILNIFKGRFKEILIPVLSGSVILPRLLIISDNLNKLAIEILYTTFFMVVIIFFSNAYLKQITLRERELEENSQRYKSLFNDNPDLVYSLDLAGTAVDANPNIENLTGYRMDEFLSRPFLTFFVPEDIAKAKSYFEKTVQGEAQTFDATVVHKNGHKIDVNITKMPIFVDEQVVGVYGIAKDITKRKRAEQTINYMAYHDTVTELPNRRLFIDMLNLSLSTADNLEQKVAVLMVDLHRFKTINDTMGHLFGDLFLKQVSERIHDIIGPDVTLARFSGDEFAIFIPNVNEVKMSSISQKIIEEFEQPLVIDGQRFALSLNIGLSLFPDHGMDAETLIKNANIALRDSKVDGQNLAKLFSPRMSLQTVQAMILGKDLLRAIEREEFQIFYQPQIDVRTRQTIGAEVFVQWNHPLMGLIPPSHFISIAEENGVMTQLGDWVLTTVCRQLQQWEKRMGKPYRISFNLSIAQLKQSDFIERTKVTLNRLQINPSYLDFEFNEKWLSGRNESLLKTMKSLKDLGISLVVDDFGTGYSSFNYLKYFPIDKVKISKTNVDDLNRPNSASAAIMLTMLELAGRLNLEVIAQGVETSTQLVSLQMMNCHKMQGFLFSKPLLPNDFESFLVSKADGRMREESAWIRRTP